MRRLLFRPQTSEWAPSTDGRLVYAVGDIHGRRDLLDLLIARIGDDFTRSGHSRCVLVFLGDYIDRGKDSRGVIDAILALSGRRGYQIVTLMGNHEQVLLNFLDDPLVGPNWVAHGGADTLVSYNVTPPSPAAETPDWDRARLELAGALPPAHLRFMKSLALSHTLGDYFFSHAGARPGVALNKQQNRDLLWIRNEFLESRDRFDKVVIHGHTPAKEPLLSYGRIGIDTGAYFTGRLTAVRLVDTEVDFIST